MCGPAFLERNFESSGSCVVRHYRGGESLHNKEERTIFLVACCKISSVAQCLVVVTASMFQEVHQ